jgi:hypothetical protein
MEDGSNCDTTTFMPRTLKKLYNDSHAGFRWKMEALSHTWARWKREEGRWKQKQPVPNPKHIFYKTRPNLFQ